MPMGCDYADLRPLAEDNGNSDWEEENEIENEAEMLISQMKRVAGHENCCKDYWTRRDQTEWQWKHWEPQQNAMVDSYMAWSYRNNNSSAPAEDRTLQDEMGITVINLFGSEYKCIPCYEGDVWQSQSLLHAGLLPTAPLAHTVVPEINQTACIPI
ncbi:hypothetical protein BT96DRAFT_999872 [Gymnopus androsaceus JB14]|uniref:Uncharacterized protein n=1 Tax=Gymnopus androsaceus JB14 TaxID=1447944 RepID=A0A6A4H4G3_9AGAR|nr:hypothetical protein BT96DRAFT_999872 [Gymnopus androsaceus JB14]